MKHKAFTASIRISAVLVLAMLLVGGILGFQQTPPDLKVEGFFGDQKKIPYFGGTVAKTPGFYYAIPGWHGHGVTREEIDAYVAASNAAAQDLLRQGVKKFYVGVTFRRYLSPAEFESLVRETRVDAKHYVLRATFPKIDPTEKVSLFGSSEAGNLISPEKLKRAQESLHYQARELRANKIADAKKSDPNDDEDWQDVLTNDEFKAIDVAEDDAALNGVYTFSGVTDARGYERLRAHPLVYHVDVTANLVFQQLKEKGVKWSDFAEDLDLSDYDTFWDMEVIGLDKFQAK